jgi:hypothetical protein
MYEFTVSTKQFRLSWRCQAATFATASGFCRTNSIPAVRGESPLRAQLRGYNELHAGRLKGFWQD